MTSVWHATDHTGRPLRCDRCGYAVEVLREDLARYARGHAAPWCAECRDDRVVLAITNPEPHIIAERRNRRARNLAEIVHFPTPTPHAGQERA